jgi:hypothetical protein
MNKTPVVKLKPDLSTEENRAYWAFVRKTKEEMMTDASKEYLFTPAELDKRFTYHPAKGTQVQRYADLRSFAKELAELIVESCPDSRERSLALTNLEQAIFWANASIARNE